MDGVTAVGGFSGIQELRFAAEYQARVAALQKDAANLQGELALKLIESAVIEPNSGRLDVKV